MRVDRRQFIHAGAVALIAGGACRSDNNTKQTQGGGTGGDSPTAASPSNSLQVSVDGLLLVEHKTNTALIQLIDATKVSLPAHQAELSVLASCLDKTLTGTPTRKDPAGTDEYWVWDLTGVNVTMPPSPNGNQDFDEDQPSSQDSLEVPTSDAGWHSPARLLDLAHLCGATHITRYDAMTSSVTLTHGHLGIGVPGSIGRAAVWNFTNPAGVVLMERAVSNVLTYTCPNAGQPLVVYIGNSKIVLLSNKAIAMSITNRPLHGVVTCPSPCTPNMDHFKALTQVVDKQFDPTIKLAKFEAMKQYDMGPDYCPGGRI